MNKKSLLAMIAVMLFACGSASAQFTNLTPSDLVANPIAGQSISVNNVNIGGLLGLNPSDLRVSVSNAIVASNTNLFAVNDQNTAQFSYSGSAEVAAFVQHGQALGTVNQNAQDGVRSATPFALDSNVTTSLDSGYQFGSTATDYFVEFTGAPTGGQSNSVPFRFASSGPVSNYTVFTTNSSVSNNNFSTGLRVVSAIPEPSSAIVLALGGLLALRRKRS